MTNFRRNLIIAGVAAALLGTTGAAQAQTWGYYDRSDWRYGPVGAVIASPFIALGAAVSPYDGYYYGPRYRYRTASAGAYLDARARYDIESQRTQPYVHRWTPAADLNVMQAEMRDHYWSR